MLVNTHASPQLPCGSLTGSEPDHSKDNCRLAREQMPLGPIALTLLFILADLTVPVAVGYFAGPEDVGLLIASAMTFSIWGIVLLFCEGALSLRHFHQRRSETAKAHLAATALLLADLIWGGDLYFLTQIVDLFLL